MSIKDVMLHTLSVTFKEIIEIISLINPPPPPFLVRMGKKAYFRSAVLSLRKQSFLQILGIFGLGVNTSNWSF